MINKNTIISSFDEKGTLLKWLKKVEDALANASLSTVQVISVSDTQIRMAFVFADGSILTSPIITLPQGPQGETGATGTGIANVAKTGTSGLVDTYTITFTNGDTTTFTVTNGQNGADGTSVRILPGADDCTQYGDGYIDDDGHLQVLVALSPKTFEDAGQIRGPQGETGATGATGNGIASIAKTGTSGLVDTYTITYTNGTTSTFTVTNGADGMNGADGADGISIVTYGTSTFADVTAILSVGTLPACIYDNKMYIYVRTLSPTNVGNRSYLFASVGDLESHSIAVSEASNNWNYIDKYLQEALTTSTVDDGTIAKAIGFDANGLLKKEVLTGGAKLYKHTYEIYYPFTLYPRCTFSFVDTKSTAYTWTEFLTKYVTQYFTIAKGTSTSPVILQGFVIMSTTRIDISYISINFNNQTVSNSMFQIISEPSFTNVAITEI